MQRSGYLCSDLLTHTRDRGTPDQPDWLVASSILAVPAFLIAAKKAGTANMLFKKGRIIIRVHAKTIHRVRKNRSTYGSLLYLAHILWVRKDNGRDLPTELQALADNKDPIDGNLATITLPQLRVPYSENSHSPLGDKERPV